MSSTLFALLLACNGADTATTPEMVTEAAATGPLVLYSGRSESLIGPLLERAERELALDIEVQYGKTPEVVTRMLTEGDESPADLIFAQDSGHLGALAERGALAKLDDSLLGEVDPRFRDADGRWIGTSGRLRVLVYNTESLSPEDLPRDLKGLADPEWKGRLGWAPGNGSFQSHVSALRHAWGEDETRAWLEGVVANEPGTYPKNSPQVEAAHTGAIDIGWVNHYYLHRLDAEGRKAENYSFPAGGEAGNVMMVAGLGIREGSPHAADAAKLIAWLIAEPAQQYFAQETYEYPTRPGVPTHEAVPSLDGVPLLDVPQTALADLGPTRTMLQELGLQ